MLTLRQDQFSALTNLPLCGLETRLRASFQSTYPDLRWLSRDNVWKSWWAAVASKGQWLNIDTTRSMAAHGLFSLWLGLGYIDDPLHSWLHDILFDDNLECINFQASDSFLNSAVEAASLYMDVTTGENGEIWQIALRKLLATAETGESRGFPSWDRQSCFQSILSLYPEKAREASSDELVKIAETSARVVCDINADEAATLPVFWALFFFGIHAFHDASLEHIQIGLSGNNSVSATALSTMLKRQCIDFLA